MKIPRTTSRTRFIEDSFLLFPQVFLVLPKFPKVFRRLVQTKAKRVGVGQVAGKDIILCWFRKPVNRHWLHICWKPENPWSELWNSSVDLNESHDVLFSSAITKCWCLISTTITLSLDYLTPSWTVPSSPNVHEYSSIFSQTTTPWLSFLFFHKWTLQCWEPNLDIRFSFTRAFSLNLQFGHIFSHFEQTKAVLLLVEYGQLSLVRLLSPDTFGLASGFTKWIVKSFGRK